jgi:lysylphosphatidylglycerol synthetase-like protein (DUF2156 family)
MMANLDQVSVKRWAPRQKVAFRIAFLFFVIMAIPWNGFWYNNVFSIRLNTLEYRNLHVFCEYTPSFIQIKTESGHWGIASYVNWAIVLLIAIIGGLIWSFFDGKRANYTVLS